MALRIAITGASGFIGGHVLSAFASTDAEITISTRTPSPLVNPARPRVVRLNLDDESKDAFDMLGRPDIVIHLAWSGLPNYQSLHHFEVELPRQYRFIRNLVDAGLKSIVVAGTCFEYGMQEGQLFEKLDCRPSNPYGLAKHTLYQQLLHLKRVLPFNLTWVRLFYSYGVGQAPSSLWSQLSEALARGDQTFDMSGGEQLRDFLPVDALANYLADLALKQLDAGIVNICSGRPQSVRRLVESWISDAGKSINLNLGRYPYPDYEPMAFWGSNQKLLQILGKI